MSSRELKGKEKATAGANGVRLVKTVIANDAVAVIVNESNPLSKLSLKDVERFFTGDITNWSAVGGKSGGISGYPNTSSGTYAFFQKFALAGRDIPLPKTAGNEQIATEVANNPNAIGYVGLAYVEAKGIKMIAVDGGPICKTANDGSYKLACGLIRFTMEPLEQLRSFDFADPSGSKDRSEHWFRAC